jgi:hypothetical protein
MLAEPSAPAARRGYLSGAARYERPAGEPLWDAIIQALL